MRPRLERTERSEGALRWARECHRRTPAAGGAALLSYRINERALCRWAISPVDIPVDNTVEKDGHNPRCLSPGPVRRSRPPRLHCCSHGIGAACSASRVSRETPPRWAWPSVFLANNRICATVGHASAGLMRITASPAAPSLSPAT